jgi:hypothetical protein
VHHYTMWRLEDFLETVEEVVTTEWRRYHTPVSTRAWDALRIYLPELVVVLQQESSIAPTLDHAGTILPAKHVRPRGTLHIESETPYTEPTGARAVMREAGHKLPP